MLSTTLETKTQIAWKWKVGEKVLCANGKQMTAEVDILISETKKDIQSCAECTGKEYRKEFQVVTS